MKRKPASTRDERALTRRPIRPLPPGEPILRKKASTVATSGTTRQRSVSAAGAFTNATRESEAVAICSGGDLRNPADPARLKAMLVVKPEIGNGLLVQQYQILGHLGESLGLDAISGVLESLAASVADGDMAHIEAVLVSQIAALNAIFVRSASLASVPTTTNPANGQERSAALMQLALKAQANCRATVQALVDLKFPRQATVFARQANVAHGPQQVNQQVNHGGQVASLPVPECGPSKAATTTLDASVGLACAHAREQKQEQAEQTIAVRPLP